jgi:hypothetical protein
MDDRRSDSPEPTVRSTALIASEPIAAAIPAPDFDGLPIPGITRRRVAFVLAALVTAWIVVVFARQVSEAAAVGARAVDAAEHNGALTRQVAAVQRELELITEPRYILQQARGYGLGTAAETPFTLAPEASPLAADAPGSAAHRLGETEAGRSPLETWLSVLFGPGPGD